MTQTDSSSRPLVAAVLAVAAMIVLVGIVNLGAAGAVAQDNNTTAADEAPLYEDNTTEPDTTGWLDGNEPDELGGILGLVSRVGTFVVGGGGTGGPGGALLSGLLVMGLGAGAVARSDVGTVAGAVLLVGGVFAGSMAGIAPQWMPAVVIFAIGLIVANVFRRVLS